MTRLKSALSYWPLIVIVGAIMGLGWSANALQSSKVDVTAFEPVKQDVTEMKIGRLYDSKRLDTIDTKLDYLLVHQALEQQHMYSADKKARNE